MRRVAEQGWTAPTWPQDYGGGGLSPAAGARRRPGDRRAAAIARRCSPSASGCWARCCWNTPTRRRRPSTCRRSSAARSAGARAIPSRAPAPTSRASPTRCEDKGDHWLINGQKIWTSYADKADWCFCLVRTDTTKKHEGICFVLIDMRLAGRRDAADQADQRREPVLRDLLHRREDPQGQPGRPDQRRLGDRQAAAAVRAAEHLRRLRRGRRRGRRLGRRPRRDRQALCRRRRDGALADLRPAPADHRATRWTSRPCARPSRRIAAESRASQRPVGRRPRSSNTPPPSSPRSAPS